MDSVKLNIAEESNSNIWKGWQNWCRLCAKEDAHNLDIFLNTTNIFTKSYNLIGNKQNLFTAIEKYFEVNMTTIEGHSKPNICSECLSLVVSLVNFNKRVARVQEMFICLKDLNVSMVDITELRLKYCIWQNDSQYKLDYPFLAGSDMLEEKPDVFDETNNFKENTTTESFLQTSEIGFAIKKENISDIPTTTVDEDICDFENEDADGEDPFASDLESNIDVDVSCSKMERQTQQKILQRISKKKSLNVHSKQYSERVKGMKTELTQFKYSCSKCSQHFQRTGNYRVHMKKKHGIEDDMPSFSCTKCSRTFITEFLLKRHIKTHRPSSEKKIFPCPQCDRKFQTNYYVATHVKLVHEDMRPFICEKCGVAKRTKDTLRLHKLTHTDNAPFICEICKKGFKDRARLKKHLDIHSSNKFTCGECGLKLNSQETLNGHKLVHSDEMRHKCDYCGRAFKRSKSLKSHLLLHSGIKPYCCEFCDKTFTSGSNCRLHMKKTHPKEFAEWEASGKKKYTKNIPKLAVLKSVVKTGADLIPVASKRSGNFASGTKHKVEVENNTDKCLYDQLNRNLYTTPSSMVDKISFDTI